MSIRTIPHNQQSCNNPIFSAPSVGKMLTYGTNCYNFSYNMKNEGRCEHEIEGKTGW